MEPDDVLQAYQENQEEIESRLEEFRELGEEDNQRVFRELVFVILSSRSAAKNAWKAATELESRGLLHAEKEDIAESLAEHEIQYELDKASYIIENRKKLSQPTLKDPRPRLKLKQRIDAENPGKTRDWMAGNLDGVGWKAASHFMRNTGHGKDFAIISSHIASSMYELGLRDTQSSPSDREDYMEAEEKLKNFSDDIDIELEALDLVLWSMRTGEVFR